MTENVYSCVKNRGVHNCISIIKKTYPKYKYYLQIDIRSFFMSIDKNILKEKVRKYLPKVKYEHISTSVDFDLSIYSYLLDVLLDFDPITNCEFRK
ncbi:MAG: hypothetical protein LBQ24_05250 [Candidatus Peribacteria bacterium]|jgi:hypothetical protein|nr:hypothetical protein [Candidatus Peribacteria bacterium]